MGGLKWLYLWAYLLNFDLKNLYLVASLQAIHVLWFQKENMLKYLFILSITFASIGAMNHDRPYRFIWVKNEMAEEIEVEYDTSCPGLEGAHHVKTEKVKIDSNCWKTLLITSKPNYINPFRWRKKGTQSFESIPIGKDKNIKYCIISPDSIDVSDPLTELNQD